MDFTDADRVDGGVFHRMFWKGMMGDKPYPAAPTGQDLCRTARNCSPLISGLQKRTELENGARALPIPGQAPGACHPFGALIFWDGKC
jgi:hypothetical protein